MSIRIQYRESGALLKEGCEEVCRSQANSRTHTLLMGAILLIVVAFVVVSEYRHSADPKMLLFALVFVAVLMSVAALVLTKAGIRDPQKSGGVALKATLLLSGLAGILTSILKFRHESDPKVAWLALGVGVLGFAAFILLQFFRWPSFLAPDPENESPWEKSYEKQTGKTRVDVVCEFDEGGFVWTGDDNEQRFAWNSLRKIILRPNGLLLYPSGAVYIWFPRRFFDAETDYAVLIRMLESTALPLIRQDEPATR